MSASTSVLPHERWSKLTIPANLRDGRWIEIWLRDGSKAEAVQFDAKALAGKGGWFNGRGHAVTETRIYEWREILP